LSLAIGISAHQGFTVYWQISSLHQAKRNVFFCHSRENGNPEFRIQTPSFRFHIKHGMTRKTMSLRIFYHTNVF